MSQRDPQILEPAPHFSPAFNIQPDDYDRPGAALDLLEEHLGHLAQLEECHWLIARSLRNDTTRAVLEAESLLDRSFTDPSDALVHHAFNHAVAELIDRAMKRVHRALSINEEEIPTEQERQWTADLYGAHPYATWLELGREMTANLGTRWLLNSAAFPQYGQRLTIRQATKAMAESAEAVPHPELRETYRRWGAALLRQMALPENN